MIKLIECMGKLKKTVPGAFIWGQLSAGPGVTYWSK